MSTKLTEAIEKVRAFNLDQCKTAYLQSIKVGGRQTDPGTRRRLWAKKVLGLNDSEVMNEDLNWLTNVQFERARLVGELNRAIIRCRGE